MSLQFVVRDVEGGERLEGEDGGGQRGQAVVLQLHLLQPRAVVKAHLKVI